MPTRLVRLAAAALAAVALPASAQVGATHALVKIQPTDRVPLEEVARIAAAANEIEAFQLVIDGGAHGRKAVRAAISDLVGPARIPASRAMLYRAAYMDVRNRSDANARRGMTPDALIPDVDRFFGEKRAAFPFDIPPGENRLVWVDVHVPPGTPAGVYRGSVEVMDAGGTLARMPVELEVHPFELPSTPTWRSAYGLSWNATCTAHHGEVWCDGDEERYDALRVLYGIAGLDNRISFSGIAGARIAGSDGDLDFTRYDRTYGPLLDGTAATRLPGARLTSIEIWQKDPGPADFAAWARHFREKGWFDALFDYTCDEPPLTCAWSDIGPRQAALHEGDPALRSLVTTTVGHLRDHGLYESTDIIVPVVNFVEGKSGAYAGDQSAAYRQAAADGKTVWLYSSCMSHGCGGTVGGEYEDPELAGWPSMMIDHTALRNRALPWVGYRFGFSGELYWDSVFAYVTRDDPWRDQWEFTGNGDGTLLYPGTPEKIGGETHVPVESIRLKLVRDGVEDYEYLKLLERWDAEAAARFAEALFPHAWSAGDISPAALLETRRAIAAAIAGHLQAEGEQEAPIDPGAEDTEAGSTEGPGDPVGEQAEENAIVRRIGRGGCAAAGAAPAIPVAVLCLGALAHLRRRSR